MYGGNDGGCTAAGCGQEGAVLAGYLREHLRVVADSGARLLLPVHGLPLSPFPSSTFRPGATGVMQRHVRCAFLAPPSRCDLRRRAPGQGRRVVTCHALQHTLSCDVACTLSCDMTLTRSLALLLSRCVWATRCRHAGRWSRRSTPRWERWPWLTPSTSCTLTRCFATANLSKNWRSLLPRCLPPLLFCSFAPFLFALPGLASIPRNPSAFPPCP